MRILSPLRGANAFLQKAFSSKNRLEESEKHARLALTVDPTNNAVWSLAWALLGEIEAKKGRFAEAEKLFKTAVSQPFFYETNLFKDEAMFRRGQFLLHQNRLAEAETQFLEIQKILPKSCSFGYGMALLAAKKGEKRAALDWLEKSFDNFWNDEKAVHEEPFFSKIRKTKRFVELMKKHFPTEKKG